MLRVDLKAAGIPYLDASGLFFDFHSLRCETGYNRADAAGVSPRVGIQKMMRYSIARIEAGRYTRPDGRSTWKAATGLLPSLKTDRRKASGFGTTGTHGKPIKELRAAFLALHAGDGIVRLAGTVSGDSEPRLQSYARHRIRP